VLGDLPSHQLHEFARHLKTCELCAQEVELLESAADAVPLLSSRPLLRNEPRLVTERSGTAVGGSSEPPPVRPRLAALDDGPSARPRRKGPFGPDAFKAKLIVFVALAVIGVVLIVMSRRSLSTGPSQYVTAKIGWSGGEALVKIQGKQAQLLVDGMPAAARSKTYAVWLVAKGARTPAPTGVDLESFGGGKYAAQIPGDIDNDAAVAVYVEPRTGRQTTASGAVIVADLRSVTESSGS